MRTTQSQSKVKLPVHHPKKKHPINPINKSSKGRKGYSTKTQKNQLGYSPNQFQEKKKNHNKKEITKKAKIDISPTKEEEEKDPNSINPIDKTNVGEKGMLQKPKNTDFNIPPTNSIEAKKHPRNQKP